MCVIKAPAVGKVKEETGLDIGDIISSSTICNIQRTQFYIVEADELIPSFTGYNHNEIADIKWFEFSQIMQTPKKFSKQVRAAAQYLLKSL